MPFIVLGHIAWGSAQEIESGNYIRFTSLQITNLSSVIYPEEVINQNDIRFLPSIIQNADYKLLEISIPQQENTSFISLAIDSRNDFSYYFVQGTNQIINLIMDSNVTEETKQTNPNFIQNSGVIKLESQGINLEASNIVNQVLLPSQTSPKTLIMNITSQEI